MTTPLHPALGSSSHLHNNQLFSEQGQLANLLHVVNSTTTKGQTASVVPPSESGPSPKRQKNSTADSIDGAPSKRAKASESNSPEADGAAASSLFRKLAPREPSKKSTRPLSREVFTSLKLTTDEWVRLEGDAKEYMLDKSHPERQSCVGRRANFTANDIKLQLFRTVQGFLRGGAGTLFFGSTDDGDDGPGSRWVYPRDEDRLVLLMTPLMRRMANNERQRQYAYRTRHSERGKSVEDNGLKSGEVPATRRTSADVTSSLPIPITIAPTLDLGLDIFQLVYLDGERVVHRSAYPSLCMHEMTFRNLSLLVQAKLRSFPSDLIATPAATAAAVSIAQRAEPNGIPSAGEESTGRRALQQAAAAASAQVSPDFQVMAHLLDGLHAIKGQEDWEFVKRQAAHTAWMTGCMKLIVVVQDTDDE